MSGAGILNFQLSNAAPVTAVVPAARIFSAHELPMGTVLPAILISEIGNTPFQYVSEASRLRIDHLQVTVHSASDAEKKLLLDLVRSTCGPGARRVNGTWVDSIVLGTEGPDLSQPDANIFEQSQDFTVRWYTPVS